MTAALALQACAPLATDRTRAAASSVGCMQAAIEPYSLSQRPDHDAHCLAAGLIALRCSASEAWLASYGKELRDLLGRGDAQWRDLQADRRGIHCARSATAEADLMLCCARTNGN